MIPEQKTLEQALAEYQREWGTEALTKSQDLLRQMRERFPRSHWPEMRLEEYALGQESSDNTFCHWLEFRTRIAGSIQGGSAQKLIIFKRKNKPGWYFPKRFQNESEAWTTLRSEFIRAFELGDKGEWDAIDDLETLALGPALRLKSLHLYFPEEILPVFSLDHLRHFLLRVDESSVKSSGFSNIQLNRRLLAALRLRPQLKSWETTELMYFLDWWASPKEARRVVKIAPGRQAMYWDDCLREGYVRVGWDEIGDLRQFDTKESFRARFAELYPYNGHAPAVAKKSNELWTLTELSPGDLVVANRGTKEVLAVGEVVEPGYEWRPELEKYKHTVAVKWDTGYKAEIPPQKGWATVTVAKVPDALFELIRKGTDRKKPGRTAVDPLYTRVASALERKGQLILYGPPGTGKTYTARRFAVWWLMRQSKEDGAKEVLGDSALLAHHEKRLSTAQMTRRVWWVVANPKQWEWATLEKEGKVTFAQGLLKRNYALAQPGDWVIGYQSTPDKKVVCLARISGELQVRDEGPSIEVEWVAPVQNALTYEDLLADPVLGKSEPLRFRCRGTLFALTPLEANRLLSLLSDRNPDLPAVDEGADEGEVGRLTRVTFHPSYAYEDFVEGFRPTAQESGDGLSLRLEDGIFKRVCRAAQADPERPYLLLIDEINRGNVAKVLGELLTLLEIDKRGLTLTLPQSKETFSIPPNVYLLGTMNTADRSIKLLDAALRRRFAFIELMPDLELLRGASVGELALDDFLEILNKRIAEAEGREKQIGHSYLLQGSEPVSEVDQFAGRFREEILPLLQEYCYDEFGTLAKFIGTELVDADAQALNHEKLHDAEQLVACLVTEYGATSVAEE